MSEQDKIITINILKKISSSISSLESKRKNMLNNLEESILIDGKTIEYKKINEIKNNNLKMKNQVASHIKNIMNN